MNVYDSGEISKSFDLYHNFTAFRQKVSWRRTLFKTVFTEDLLENSYILYSSL